MSKSKEEIKEEILREEFTEDEYEAMFVKAFEDNRTYEGNLKKSLKTMLNSRVVTLSGHTISVADKLAINVVQGLVAKGDNITPEDLINVQKATGEYTEKKELGVSGIEQFIDKVTDKNEF